MYKVEVGDKVICINQGEKYLVLGETYTIEHVYISPFGIITVKLVERPYNSYGVFRLKAWFKPDFRLKKIRKIKERICMKV
jgi:hypothetical protein